MLVNSRSMISDLTNWSMVACSGIMHDFTNTKRAAFSVRASQAARLSEVMSQVAAISVALDTIALGNQRAT